MSDTSNTISFTPIKSRRAPKKWEDDGVEGGPSSIDIVLDWITLDKNYARWKGGSGVTKQYLSKEIVNRIKEAGIYHRNATDVRNKILSLQNAYNKARDWGEKVGEEIRMKGEDDAMGTIQVGFKSICKYWDVLNPIFADTTASRSIFATGNLDVAEEFGNGDEDNYVDNNLDNNLEYNDVNGDSIEDIDNTTNRSTTALVRSKGKRPMKFKKNKKSKVFLAEAVLEGKRLKVEFKREILEFSKKKWEDKMEEKRRQSRIKEEQKRLEHELTMNQANIERAIAKSSLMKSLAELGLSREDILEQLKAF